MRHLISALFLACALLTAAGTAHAQADACTSVAAGTNQNITAHGECRNVAFAGFGGAAAVCAPTNTTLAEWQSFYNNPPAGVTITACAASCSGYSYAGYCYYGSPSNVSCDGVCGSYGGCNLTGTRYVGSADTSGARCSAVVSGITATSVTASSNNAGTGEGCVYTSLKGGWVGSNYYQVATTCAATNVWNRVCACGSAGGGGAVNGVCDWSGGCTSGTYQFVSSGNYNCPGPYYGTVNTYNCLGSGGGTSEYNCHDGWGQTCCGSVPC